MGLPPPPPPIAVKKTPPASPARPPVRPSPGQEVVDAILERCREVETGARNVDHILNRTLLPELAAQFLASMAEGEEIGNVNIDVGESGTFTYSLEPK